MTDLFYTVVLPSLAVGVAWIAFRLRTLQKEFFEIDRVWLKAFDTARTLHAKEILAYQFRIVELEKRPPAPEGILLPGWDCPSCRAFNGTLKEDLKRCRCCDAPRISQSA